MFSEEQREKFYWRSVMNEVESIARKKSRRERIKNYDFYATLPKNLQKRVAKIIPLEYSDEIVEVKPYQEIETIIPKNGEEIQNDQNNDFNESTFSIIERKEKEFPKFHLNLENTVVKKATKKKQPNWYSSYICSEQKKRIKWKSKIYQMEKSIWEKPLDEQAEQLMDASAEHFTEWVNNLGSQSTKNMTKEQLKSIFPIEGSGKLLSSVQTDPKEVKAIAKAVADRWNLPEMAIELKYEKYINSTLKQPQRNIKNVAFGRTIPYKDRPWIRPEENLTIETVFPEELRSGEHLFKGIAHLRSTKALIDYCKKKPSFPRPKYLVEKGFFEETAKKGSDTDVPLYELLKIK